MQNPNKITFTINDKEINLVFDVSSLTEMGRILFYPKEDLKLTNPSQYEKELAEARRKSNDISEIFEEMNRITEMNFWFSAKILIYSGTVGYSLQTDSPRPLYTFEEVGKLVGQMTQSELMDYTLKVWQSFLDQIGINLEKLVELEGQDTGEKKK